jgi:hypothetical protein
MGVREPLGTREGVSTVRRSFIPLVVSAVLFAAWGGTIRAQDLACADITSCKGSARCGTSGEPLGCVLQCSDGTTIYCPYKETGPGDLLAQRRCSDRLSAPETVPVFARSVSLSWRDVLVAFARAWSRIDPKRSQLLLRLARGRDPVGRMSVRKAL